MWWCIKYDLVFQPRAGQTNSSVVTSVAYPNHKFVTGPIIAQMPSMNSCVVSHRIKKSHQLHLKLSKSKLSMRLVKKICSKWRRNVHYQSLHLNWWRFILPFNLRPKLLELLYWIVLTKDKVHLHFMTGSLQWRHNERDGVSNHRRIKCLLNSLFRRRSKKNIKAPRHWPLWGEFTGDRWIPRTKGQ